MCGIAGYSLNRSTRIDRTLAAQALLAGIAERGADAVGYAHREGRAAVSVHKQRTGATELLDRIEIPAGSTEALVHVRDYTKGHPTIAANNHPIRHGRVVGIHNGIIFNDDEIMAAHGFAREEPEMTVDSEAIFALAEAAGGRAGALEELRGSMAAAWLDERHAGLLFLARGVGRPIWLGLGGPDDGVAFFASTERTLEIVETCLSLGLDRHELEDGTLLALSGGRVAGVERFRPDNRFEERPLPAVRAPDEGAACLARLATIAALG